MSESKQLTRLQAEDMLASKFNLYGSGGFFSNRDAAAKLAEHLNMQDPKIIEAFEQEFEALLTPSFQGGSWLAHCLSATAEQITSAVCSAVGIEVEGSGKLQLR